MELANILEEGLISKYNTINNQFGYNMIAGGNNKTRRQEVTDRIAEKNRNPSPETLRKMSLASRGRRHSKETIEKIRQSNIGKKRSEESKKKMSIAKQNMSEETKRKISEAGKGRKISDKCIQINRQRFIGNKIRARKITQYTLGGDFIKTWDCAMDVEREIGIDHGNIGKCCNNNALSAGGFQWKYYDGTSNNISPINRKDKRKKIIQCDLNGNFIKLWDSKFQIYKELGYETANILKCCKGEIKSSYGFIWKQKEEKKNE